MSEFVVGCFILFIGLAFANTSASVPRDSGLLNIQKGVFVSLHLRLRDHIEQYSVLEVLDDSGCDMSLGFLAYSVLERLTGVFVSRFGIHTILALSR